MARNSRNCDIYPISVRELEVHRVEDITPGMRRVFFKGEQLASHHYQGHEVAPFISTGFDDDIRLIFPHPVTGERPRPEPDERGILQWSGEVKDLFRTYTVRAWDEERGEVTVDFARHGMGLAEDWSAQAEPGQKLWVAGPKNCFSLPVHRDWLMLIGDETALPAISRCLEELPQGYPVQVFVEVAELEHRLELESQADMSLQWAIRSQGEDCVSLLEETLNSQEGILPEGKPYIWVAGESGKLRRIRALIKGMGIPKEDAHIIGYWRESEVHRNEEGVIEGGGYSIFEELHNLLDIAPAFAVRVAMKLGLFEKIAEAPGERIRLNGLLQQCAVSVSGEKVDLDAVERLIAYLGSISLLQCDKETEDKKSREPAGKVLNDQLSSENYWVSLTPMSRELLDTESLITHHVQEPYASRVFSLIELERSIMGQEDSEKNLWTSRKNRPVRMEVEADYAQWVAPAVAELVTGQEILCLGMGATVFAEEILRKSPQSRVSVLTDSEDYDISYGLLSEEYRDKARVVSWANYLASQAGTARIDTERRGSKAEEGRVSSVKAVLVDPYAQGSAEEYVARLSPWVDKIYVVTDILPDQGGEEHQYEEDLIRLCSEGGRVPKIRDIEHLMNEYGWICSSSLPIGWGISLLECSKII